jgi:hypothetical protein
MSENEDPDSPPASPDSNIQGFLDVQWYAALNGTTEALDALRQLYPLMSVHLPETASDHIKRALASVESANSELHRTGKYVIGQASYDDLLDEQTRRKINE